MPGYYLHLAACHPESRENRSFVYGVEAPDILKAHLKLYGIEGARKKYNSFKTEEMPEYERLENRIKQKERIGSKEGLHYGVSSSPNIWECWNSLDSTDRQNPFYRGYIWHLLTDKLMYDCLNIDRKFQCVLEKNRGNTSIEEFRKSEIRKLHEDWDKTNAKVRDAYPDVIITPEVEELQVVKFIEVGKLYYVDWEILKSVIDFLRNFNPITVNMDAIIIAIMQND